MSSLTLSSLSMEGKKMLHHKSVDKSEVERFHRLAVAHQDLTKKLDRGIKYMGDKKLLEKRFGYVRKLRGTPTHRNLTPLFAGMSRRSPRSCRSD
jgi:hypothetical protein